ncbi:MAG: hypothetical protein KGJ07_01240 [Patescibacteria group bacterium]|nr:hypothetical protein [Patescibacteria group bacterium]MDE2590390.1 hypothetical protein [Patescibacteria group bacterium]
MRYRLGEAIAEGLFRVKENRYARNLRRGRVTAAEGSAQIAGRNLYRDINAENAILRVGLSHAQRRLIVQNSRGFLGVTDFLKYWVQHPEKHQDGGFALGIDDGLDKAHSLAATTLGLLPWRDAYKIFSVNPKSEGHCDVFMERLTKTDRPIVFFLPPHVFNYFQEDVQYETRDELRWFLRNPATARNTFFVAGLYDMANIDHLIAVHEKNPGDSQLDSLMQTDFNRLLSNYQVK